MSCQADWWPPRGQVPVGSALNAADKGELRVSQNGAAGQVIAAGRPDHAPAVDAAQLAARLRIVIHNISSASDLTASPCQWTRVHSRLCPEREGGCGVDLF